MASKLLEAAHRYLAMGFSLIPCTFKKADFGWQQYQIKPPTLREVNHWFDPEFDKGNLSIGVILGAVSQNVVAIDLDGIEPMRLFDSIFHHLTDTRIVISGSGKGAHLYYQVAELPANINVRTSNGGFEIRGNGQYVIAPPSPHPSGKLYTVYRSLPIKQVDNLNDVWNWFNAMRPSESLRQDEISQAARPVQIATYPSKQKILSLILSETVAQVSVATAGSRNMRLFYAGLRLANYAAGGEFSWSNCEALLLEAARNVGTPENEAKKTIESAWKIGRKNPKKVK